MTSRVQVLFEPIQVSRLQAIAEAEGKSVGALIRAAVEQVYLEGDRDRRLAAVARMAAMALPVADWEQMEQESSDRYEDG